MHKWIRVLPELWKPYFGAFSVLQAKPIGLFFKNWHPPLFLLYDVKHHGKKIEKAEEPEILHCRQMKKWTKPNWKDTLAKVGVQLIFAPRRWYRLSVAVWWYILVRLYLVKLFASQGLIQAFLGLFDEHRLICCNITCFSSKTSTWDKGNKDSDPFPHNCCLITVLQCSSRRFLQSDCARK